MSLFVEATKEEQIYLLFTLTRGAESRKKIIKVLSYNPKNCKQIADEIQLDWWTVQKHLQILLKNGIIARINFGHIAFYKLTIKGEEILKPYLI